MCRVVSCLLALLLVCVSVPTAFGEANYGADNGVYVPAEFFKEINEMPIEQVGPVLGGCFLLIGGLGMW